MSLANEIIYGTPQSVTRLIETGANVNEIDEYGFTPLIETAIVNNIDMAQILLSKGAHINQPDTVGRTALHWAVDNRNIPLCKLLLENKVNVNAYTTAGQSVLVNPLLRGQNDLKKLLYQYRASLPFAQDFINTKLIGHRYELRGQVDILDYQEQFIELDLEGFFLEFTIGIIQNSLRRYRNNFAAKELRNYFNNLQLIINTLAIAAELIKYQHYTADKPTNQAHIDSLLEHELLLLPIAYQGHAITFIKYQNLLAICDRGDNSKIHGSVVLYRIRNEQAFDKSFSQELVYKRHTAGFIHGELHNLLGLTPLMQLPIAPQITGNCSWANVEATVPTMLFILLLKEVRKNCQCDLIKAKNQTQHFYTQWLDWDKDRSLEECIKGFYYTTSNARRATKASLLAAILFQACDYNNPKDVERAQKILPILRLPEFEYILKTYLRVYSEQETTAQGKNLLQLLDL